MGSGEMERKNWKMIIICGLLLFVLLGSIAIAKGPSKPAGESNKAHLYLFEKDPNTWDIVEKGSWGKMKYNLEGSTFDFKFIGHKLLPEEEFTLIYYPDPWPGSGLICLGTNISDEDGNINIRGSLDVGDLPAEYDENYPDGAKIWLVLSCDVDCEAAMMIDWNPTEYLFEFDLITFNHLR